MDIQFDHIGIPTDESQPTEFWVPETEVWVTNPRTDPQRIEYLRFKNKPEAEPGSAAWKLWNMPHIAYRVDDLQEAIQGEEIILEPFQPAEFATIAFIHKHGTVIEYLQYHDTDTWFGQATPWTAP